MWRSLSDHETHELYCPVRHVKSALFLVVCFTVTTIASWRGLHKAPETPSFVQSLFSMLVVAALIRWLFTFTCFRERLICGLMILSLLAGQVQKLLPSVIGEHSEVIRIGKLSLSVLGLVVSLTMLVQSARGSAQPPQEVPRPS
jgi:hypothetical protein